MLHQRQRIAELRAGLFRRDEHLRQKFDHNIFARLSVFAHVVRVARLNNRQSARLQNRCAVSDQDPRRAVQTEQQFGIIVKMQVSVVSRFAVLPYAQAFDRQNLAVPSDPSLVVCHRILSLKKIDIFR